ncbi:MAG: peptide deformylase [Verrucomicrobia bacterium]|nr:peptide deformylase [Verrucomicrobiota bacterium]
MILPVVQYGHPVLRQKGSRVQKITPEIERLISDMFETMHAAHGIGLAAQQVGHALQLTVLDIREVKDRPSTLQLGGVETDPHALMPLVLINPELKPVAEPVKGPEGCLSFPEMYADIARAEAVEISALNAQGERIQFRCGGLLARAIQHETDHLHGILFIDRMDRETKQKLKTELDELQAATKAALKKTRLD